MRDPGAPRRNPLFEEPRADDAPRAEHEECYACPVGQVFEALHDAQPEALEHFLAAAKELLAATRSVVESAERAVDEQRERLRERRAGAGGDDAADAAAEGGEPPRIRRIDLA